MDSDVALRKKIVAFSTFLFLCNLFGLLTICATNKKIGAYTESMKPIFNGGEVVFLSNHHIGENLTGKIVAYSHEDKTIGHRVVEDHGSYVKTKGDNNQRVDPWNVSRGYILGEITFWCSFQIYLLLVVTFVTFIVLSGIYTVQEVRGIE